MKLKHLLQKLTWNHEPSIPRRVCHQAHHVDTPSSSPDEYYKHAVTIPFLDHLLSEMKNRFDENCIKMSKIMKLMPSNVFASLTVNDLEDFLSVYGDTSLQSTQNCIVGA